jgi:hypothetical protein
MIKTSDNIAQRSFYPLEITLILDLPTLGMIIALLYLFYILPALR